MCLYNKHELANIGVSRERERENLQCDCKEEKFMGIGKYFAYNILSFENIISVTYGCCLDETIPSSNSNYVSSNQPLLFRSKSTPMFVYKHA